MYIEKINGPEDVKKLNIEEMTALAEEMRHALLKRASIHGGHFGPNFGMVEAIIALHYVFESPKDKMVFDVSHQTYPHKMLTGRKDAYLYEEHYDDVTGYSCPQESEHDHFTIGHTSTSISLACGLAKARDLRGESANVIAIIGDGSLSGGEALEGMDFAAELDSNMIIVVNDNDMSIAENHGGLYSNLKLLRETNGQAECNLFKAMGLDYVYVDHGNDLRELIGAFKQVKDSKKPVVVHINTLKGKGYKPAEEHKEECAGCGEAEMLTATTPADEDPLANDPTRREIILGFQNKLNIKTAGTTRADAPIATTEENEITSLDIYVFSSDKEEGPYTYQERFCYRSDGSTVPNATKILLTVEGAIRN